MWEISVIFEKENANAAKFLYKEIKKSFFYYNNVVTLLSEDDKVKIVLACEEVERRRTCFFLVDAISETICTYFKYKFIDENLKVAMQNKVNLQAFKKALVSFDRETDKYIVSKTLDLNDNLMIESFFNFKLRKLKDKWLELVALANDNATYLVCNDTFIELLRFLVENLEIAYDEINVVKENGRFKICDQNFNDIEPLEESKNEEEDIALVTTLIALCPKKINVYCDRVEDNNAINLIAQIFENRLKFFPRNSVKILN